MSRISNKESEQTTSTDTESMLGATEQDEEEEEEEWRAFVCLVRAPM